MITTIVIITGYSYYYWNTM